MSVAHSDLLHACRRESAQHTPVWFMRQAGRSLPEYRAVRAKHSFMEVCRQPELCAEITLQPVRRLGVDAAILFADIMTPLIAIGVDLELKESVGPVIAHPIATERDLEQLRPLDASDIPFVTDAIKLVKHELGDATPLIGFAGAPFTLASYLIEGRGSRNFTKTKALMYGAPTLWHALMVKLSDMTIAYLSAKVRAGVDVVQLFDSWVGCLSPMDYTAYVQPYSRQIIQAVRETGVPVIHFGTNTATLLPLMATDGASVVGADWRIPLDDAWTAIGYDTAIQGNIDPALLLAPWSVVEAGARDVLRRAGGRAGHIFNLGHGIYPETPLDTLIQLVAFVQNYREQ